MSRRFRLIMATLTMVTLLAACGDAANAPGVATLNDPGASTSPGSSPSPSAAISFQDAALAYARCMRENGVDVPDPQISTNGDGGVSIEQGGGAPVSKEEMSKADAACRKYMAAAAPNGPGHEMSPEDMDKLLAFAKCMREHGVDMPDPTTDGGFVMRVDDGTSNSGGPGGGSTKGGPDDPAFEAAQTACGSLLPGKPTMNSNGGPPPAGGGTVHGSSGGAASSAAPQ